MDLLKESTKKIYFKFLMPSLSSAMVMSIYTLTDAVVVGKGVGSNGLAGLSITTPLLCVLMSLGILIGVGGSVKTSIAKGENNTKKANEYFTSAFILITLSTILIWILYGVFVPQLLKLIGANKILYPYSYEYMKYILYLLPVATYSNFFAIYNRADGDPNRAMIGTICGGVVNIILDIYLVMFAKIGIGGAAIASIIGMLIQLLINLTHFISNKNTLKLVKSKAFIHQINEIIKNGTPSFFNEFANGFIVLLFNIQILKYCGATALAVYSVISNCVILFNSLFTGVGQSIQPIISINYGANKYKRIDEIKKYGYVTIIIMGMIFSLLGILFPNIVCSVFLTTNSELIKISNVAIRLYFIAFLPMGINLLTSYYFQSVLCSKKSLTISLLRNIFLSIIFIIVFPLVFTANSLWVVMPCVEIIVLIISYIMLKNSKNKNIKH